ncbi:MAG: hypothetical protein ACREPM_21380 [Gemmatimonadaceae bacterium]
MNPRKILARRSLFAAAFMMLLPLGISVSARLAGASGYSMTSGINGEPICNPGGEDDCPQ